MAEVHIIGQIDTAENFDSSNLLCKYGVVTGNGWKLIGGQLEGQTQVSSGMDDRDIPFCHPIDLHFLLKGIQGWPKLYFEVWSFNKYGNCDIIGYGFCHVPTSPGYHQLKINTWKPIGNFFEQFSSSRIGGSLVLKKINVIFEPQDRFYLKTCSSGLLNLKLNILLRNFKKYGLEM